MKRLLTLTAQAATPVLFFVFSMLTSCSSTQRSEFVDPGDLMREKIEALL